MEIVSKPDMRSSKQARPTSPRCARSCAISAPPTATWRRATCAPTSTSRCGGPGDEARHPLRDQERQLDPLHRPGHRATRRAARSRSWRTAAAIKQETRLFDSDKGVTRSMRSKEEAHDYRYFPDPDLLPLELTQAYVDGLHKACPSCPTRSGRASASEYGLSAYDAGVLMAERESAEFFEAVAKGRDGKTAANWVINELFGRLNKDGLEIERKPGLGGPARRHHRPDRRRHHLRQDRQGRVRDRLERGRRPGRDRREARPRAGHRHRRHRGGRRRGDRRQSGQGGAGQGQARQAIGWFVGQVMKETGGKANPQAVNETLRSKIDFSELIPSASTSMFDGAAVAEFRAKWRRKSGSTEIDSWNDERLLEKAELTIDGHPTYAGLVLLGTSEAVSHYLANAETIFEYRSSENSVPYQQRMTFRRGFFAWADEIWSLINLRKGSYFLWATA